MATTDRFVQANTMADNMLKLYDDLRRRRVAPEAARDQIRSANAVLGWFNHIRKLRLDTRQLDIDVTPKKTKALPATK